MSNESLVLDRHPLADKGVAGDLDAASDLRPFLNLDKRPDPGVIADFSSIQVDEVPDDHIFAQLHIGGNAFPAHSRTSRPPCRMDSWAATRS